MLLNWRCYADDVFYNFSLNIATWQLSIENITEHFVEGLTSTIESFCIRKIEAWLGVVSRSTWLIANAMVYAIIPKILSDLQFPLRLRKFLFIHFY